MRALLAFVVLLASCGGSDSEPDESRWTPVSGVPEVLRYGAVWSFGPDDVWLTAEAGRVLHYDGATWTESTLETGDTMLGIWAFGPNDLWMVGGDTLARYDGSAWTITNFREESTTGIEGLSAIWGSAPNDVWVGGGQSTAAHWDGTTWQRFIAAGTDNTSVWGSGPDDVYMVGTSDFAHWGGSDWAELEIGDGLRPMSVWGFSANDVWVADGSESMAHYDGATWTVIELDVIGGLTTLWGRTPEDMWGVGDFGSISHYDGNQWQEVATQRIGSPYLRIFHGVHGSDAGDVWVVGSELGDGGNTPLLWRHDPS